jgi:hypothetical protein
MFPKDTTGDEVECKGERERKIRVGEETERARKNEESKGGRAGKPTCSTSGGVIQRIRA